MFNKKWSDKFVPKFFKSGYNINILHITCNYIELEIVQKEYLQ